MRRLLDMAELRLKNSIFNSTDCFFLSLFYFQFVENEFRRLASDNDESHCEMKCKRHRYLHKETGYRKSIEPNFRVS